MSWGLDYHIMQIKSPPQEKERRELPKAITEERLQQLGVKLERAMRYQERKAFEDEAQRKQEERHRILMKSLKDVPTRVLELAVLPKHKQLLLKPPNAPPGSTSLTPASSHHAPRDVTATNATASYSTADAPSVVAVPAYKPPSLRQRRRQSLQKHLSRVAARDFTTARSHSREKTIPTPTTPFPGKNDQIGKKETRESPEKTRDLNSAPNAIATIPSPSPNDNQAMSGTPTPNTTQHSRHGSDETQKSVNIESIRADFKPKPRRVRRKVSKWVYSADDGWIRKEEEIEEEIYETIDDDSHQFETGGQGNDQNIKLSESDAENKRENTESGNQKPRKTRSRPRSQSLRTDENNNAQNRPQWGWSGFRRTQDAPHSHFNFSVADVEPESKESNGSRTEHKSEHRRPDPQRVERLAIPRTVTTKFTVEKPDYETYMRRRAERLTDPVPGCVERLSTRAKGVPIVVNTLPTPATITIGQINYLALPLSRHARPKADLPSHRPRSAEENVLKEGRQRLLKRPKSGVALKRQFVTGASLSGLELGGNAHAVDDGVEKTDSDSGRSGHHARTQSWSQLWGSARTYNSGPFSAFPPAFPDPPPKKETTSPSTEVKKKKTSRISAVSSPQRVSTRTREDNKLHPRDEEGSRPKTPSRATLNESRVPRSSPRATVVDVHDDRNDKQGFVSASSPRHRRMKSTDEVREEHVKTNSSTRRLSDPATQTLRNISFSESSPSPTLASRLIPKSSAFSPSSVNEKHSIGHGFPSNSPHSRETALPSPSQRTFAALASAKSPRDAENTQQPNTQRADSAPSGYGRNASLHIGKKLNSQEKINPEQVQPTLEQIRPSTVTSKPSISQLLNHSLRMNVQYSDDNEFEMGYMDLMH